MDIELMREFIVLSQTLNYTKAAEKLHLTQPTLSKHVVSIEKELACQLLTRDRRRVELTDAGEIFAASAIQIVDTYDETQLKISEIQTRDPIRVNGQLLDTQLSAIISIASSVISEEGHPPIVYENPSDGNFIERLLSSEIDIAITFVDPQKMEELDFGYAPLLRVQFAMLVSLDSPLSRMKSASIDDLRNCRFIKFVDKYASMGWSNIEMVCRNHGFTPRTRTVLNRSHMNYTSVPLGPEDVCILESSMPQLQYLSSMARVAVIPIVDDDASFRLYAIYRNDNYDRVKFALDAYTAARRIVVSYRNGAALVDTSL